ncbi:MAG: parallel beta-helix domain-containing protein [Henriciella sp.]|nr:parallel beta-helix domain-containing protein [Henriciella sp.]
MIRSLAVCVCAVAVLTGCGDETSTPADSVEAGPVDQADGALAPGEGFADRLQMALIEAEPGATITLPDGTFELVDGLSLDVAGVTLTGAGQGKTILDFAGQTGAGEGLLVTSDDVTLSGFTMRDTKGDGIKSKGADRIVYRDLTVEWSGEPDESNGAYGVYPVESSDVLVERVTVRGASDAGIYVGQSDNIIVRDSLAEYNVAGIEIENSTRADVYGNTVTKNAGGLLVFDLPDLPKVGGHSTRLFNNQIFDNNTRNFAPPGNIVASVPSGTGIIIQANEKVEVFDNTLDQNRTAHVLVVAYSPEFEDERFNPLPRNVLITGNTYGEGGYEPQGDLAMLAPLVGGELPDIVSDGVNRWQGGDPADLNLIIDEPEDIGYLSLGLGEYPLNPLNLSPSRDRPTGGEMERLPSVDLTKAE